MRVKCFSCKSEVLGPELPGVIDPARGARVANALAVHRCPARGIVGRMWRAVTG